MNDLQLFNTDIEMLSTEVVELINKFREQESNRKELTHYNFLQSIDKEIQSLQNVGISTELNFQLCYFQSEEGGRKYRAYKMSKKGIMQMLNKESAYVRFKTQEYIEALENKITQQQQLLIIQEQRLQLKEKDEQIQRLEGIVGIRAKEKFDFVNYIKRHLGITKIADNKADYCAIRDMLFIEMKVSKWEDISYSREAVKLLKEICDDFNPKPKVRKQRSLW